MDEKRKAVNVDEFAAEAGISRGLAYRMIREGKIPHVRFGKRIVIPKATLERFLSDPAPNATAAA